MRHAVLCAAHCACFCAGHLLAVHVPWVNGEPEPQCARCADRRTNITSARCRLFLAVLPARAEEARALIVFTQGAISNRLGLVLEVIPDLIGDPEMLLYALDSTTGILFHYVQVAAFAGMTEEHEWR